MVTGIAFTGYSVSSLEVARSFYEGLLDLSPSVVAGPPDHGVVEYDLGPSTLSITNRLPFLHPSPGGGFAVLEVNDLVTFAARLERLGVRFAVPVSQGPSCQFAVVRDPDGNLLGLHQRH
jgi:catechol 2,3-dioxygenase-like lactoylglutathione lyase family enzyme